MSTKHDYEKSEWRIGNGALRTTHIYAITGEFIGRCDDQDIALEICREHNSHRDLLQAAKIALRGIELLVTFSGPTGADAQMTANTLRAAIAKAETGQ